ncbi:MAG TPA: glycosyltransferase [Candidatus Angelobacter sp.]|nr:glycosyltransferase [Candidatus Angelobacter sp.]
MSPQQTVAELNSTTRPPQTGTVTVSIIIPALNEERMVGRCLDSLAKLDFVREKFEVVLVDNGSTDKTLEIAESFQDRLNLRILQKTGVRISGLRNLGAQEARGEIVAFLDADCLANSDWLKQILEFAPGGSVGVVGAHYLLPEDSSWVGRTWHRYQEAGKSGEVSHVPAGDLIMRREDFLRLGGFDESIQTNEDYELCERVRKAGMTVRAYPEIGVVHLGTAQSLRVFFHKQAWHGTHVVKVFLRNISGSHNLKAVLFAVWTLICLAGIVAGAAWTIFNRAMWPVVVVAITGLLLPPMVLAMKQVLGSRKWTNFFPLTALYLAYGVARARALMTVRNLFS